ncbi:GDSL-type esterase/lipase family protein, partial [Proteiniphilum sp. UBA1028]|uniref:GDSL-type esterase/lipase family protein n=1 Tax=Proteiniphilum sp. UBA1028 TaxID=1947251 RepID=UPI0025FC1BA8
MIKKRILFVLLLIPALLTAEPVKVACVGNSVTFGYKIENRANTYPAQLQRLLGDFYRVENFGHSGATLLQKGHNPYRKMPAYEKALTFEPDIVVIHLGLNDTDPRNWPKFRDDFTKDYIELIRSFQEKNPAAKVWICRMTPIFSWHPRFKSSTRMWYDQVQAEIERVAKVTG